MPILSKEKIKTYLLQRDPKLAQVFRLVDYPVFKRNKDVYAALLHSIISQQLSVKAAATIHRRLLNLFPEDDAQPAMLLNMSLTRLRSAGLSKQKSSYVKAVASIAIEDGLDYDILAKRSDVEIIEYLTKIYGVGQWTVEMLLMFTFNRKDVFPLGDLGIQNAMRRLYNICEEGKEFKDKLLSISVQWKPYRTVVCKYLWDWSDP